MDTPLPNNTFAPTNKKTNIMNIPTSFIQKQRSSWFKDWFDTNFYHQLYANRDEKEAAQFVDNLINELQPPEHSTMLDLGCGAGRHTKQLAAHGFHVTGLDLAASSIRAAKKVHVPGTQFYQHDMRIPFCIARFNYVFSFFTSFGYFKTQDENNAVIYNIANSLKPKGTLVMDYLNVNYSEAHQVEREKKEIDGVNYHIRRWHNDTHFYKYIKVTNVLEHGNVEYTEQVEKLRLTDFDILFKRNGLRLKKVFGDYDLNAYDPEDSPRLIMIAEKL
jgi:SAM-dependent methyltransferase